MKYLGEWVVRKGSVPPSPAVSALVGLLGVPPSAPSAMQSSHSPLWPLGGSRYMRA